MILNKSLFNFFYVKSNFEILFIIRQAKLLNLLTNKKILAYLIFTCIKFYSDKIINSQ